jgi:Family of unknown function (DUF6152)
VRVAAAAVLAGLVGLGAVPAYGHHSEAAFDTTKIVAFRGTVTRFAWKNPHVYIYVTAQDQTGAPADWEIETGATPILTRSGWTPESLKPGDVITVRAHPERNEAHRYAILLSLQKADGTILMQKPADTAAARASSIAGVWRGREETIGPIYEQLSKAALTEKGIEAKAAYDFFRDNPVAQCIAPPTPGILAATALFLAEIEVLEDRILMRSEFFDVERTIWTDGRGHPENGERTNQGHSIGHWEGDVLVVDTTLFASHRTGNGEGVPTGPDRHVVERYRLSDDHTRLLIDVRVEDPEYLAEPFVSSLEWEYAPQLKLSRYGCEKDVSRRFMLR